MKVLLAGLWARRGLNAAALLMTVIALTAAACAAVSPGTAACACPSVASTA